MRVCAWVRKFNIYIFTYMYMCLCTHTCIRIDVCIYVDI